METTTEHMWRALLPCLSHERNDEPDGKCKGNLSHEMTSNKISFYKGYSVLGQLAKGCIGITKINIVVRAGNSVQVCGEKRRFINRQGEN